MSVTKKIVDETKIVIVKRIEQNPKPMKLVKTIEGTRSATQNLQKGRTDLKSFVSTMFNIKDLQKKDVSRQITELGYERKKG